MSMPDSSHHQTHGACALCGDRLTGPSSSTICPRCLANRASQATRAKNQTWLFVILGLGISCSLGVIFVLTLVVYFWFGQFEATLPVGMSDSGAASANSAQGAGAEGNQPNSTSRSIGAVQEAKPVRPALEYRWDPNTTYTWQFDIKVKSDRGEKQHKGISSFRARNKQPTLADRNQQSASGTGFVVHSSGLLVTCAHVVDNATKVGVRLGNDLFSAEVIASDLSNDLALIKISGKNLQALPLAPAGSIELGQEIRSIGYPLKDILGNSVKINRGMLSGKVEIEGRELFQIDAAINPGNSGGPIIDSNGNVIGVASEKIYGQGISNIGFCIPSHVLLSFLEQQNVQPNLRNNSPNGTSPPFNEIIPSVGLVEVELGNQKLFELMDYSEFDQRSDPAFRLRTLRQQLERGSLIIDLNGMIQDNQGAIESPSLLGPLAALPLLPLPRPWQTTWGEASEIELNLVVGEANQDPLRSLFPSPFSRYRFGLEPQYEVKKVAAVQSEKLKMLHTAGDVVSIEREILIASKGEIRIQHRMTWRYDFDTKKALVVKAQGEGEFVVDDDKISTMEVQLSYQPERETRLDAQPSIPIPDMASENTTTTKKSQSEIPTELQEALERLADTKTVTEERIAQLNRLTAMTSNSKFRQKVVDQISSDLNSQEDAVVCAAVKALRQWDVATRVEQVVPLLQHASGEVRLAAVEYLGAMQDGSTTLALVNALHDKDLRDSIYAAMRSIGPTGEAGVLNMLTYEDEAVRIEGCLILEEVGSARCATELKRLANGDGKDSQQAKKTLIKLGLSQDLEPAPREEPAEENPFESKKKPK